MANESEEAGGSNPDPWPHDFNRERGIFTPRDRRFLAGGLDDELTENEKRQKRYRLRQRMFHAIQDLFYLRSMETRDIGQVAELIDEGITPEENPAEDPMDSEIHRRSERVLLGIEEMIAFLREVSHSGVFRYILEEQLGIRNALDHYEETGRYGVFDVSLNVELKEEMEMDELRNLSQEERLSYELPGAWEVLDRHDPLWRYASSKDYDPEHWAAEYPSGEAAERLMKSVLNTMHELDDGNGADREELIKTVGDREGVDAEKVAAAIEANLMQGECYEPAPGVLKPI